MPETRGHSLENISEMFRVHRVADIGFVRLLKSLAARLGLSSANSVSSVRGERNDSQVVFGNVSEERLSGVLGENIEIENTEGIELETLNSVQRA